MAEGRMLKNKISTDAGVADLSNDTHRILFTWGIVHLDIEGRITGEPREFKAKVAPLLDHITRDIVLEFFQDAVKMGLIERYSVHNKWVVQYPGFKKNQTLRKDRESSSSFPPPPEDSRTTPGPPPEDSRTTPGPPPEDSRTTPAEVKLSKVKLSKEKNMADFQSAAPPQKVNGRNFEAEFEVFYAAYPNKKKPVHARKAFISTAKTGRLPPLDVLLAALEDQKTWPEWKRDNGRFIDHPSTWINGECWKNERTGTPRPNGRSYATRADHTVIEND